MRIPDTPGLFAEIWQALGLSATLIAEGDLPVRSPIDGSLLGQVRTDDDASVDRAIESAVEAFRAWRNVPAPRRGELVRLLGEELRASKTALGRLVSLETGKIESEGLGEVQEMIDICDFAVGLSRQLYGLTITSERPEHRMMEQWHPLGPVGIITAFNFPVAVWSWNAALALVCGDPVVWKPSEKTPLTALAVQHLFERAAARFGAPELTRDLGHVTLGGASVGARLAADTRLPLISATGSTRMGKALAPVVAARFGRALLELGGNNAVVVAAGADLDLAVRAIAFGAVGTAGQRCTTTRRLIVHATVRSELLDRLVRAYESVPIGHPLVPGTLLGPLIDAGAGEAMDRALAAAVAEGGTILTGGERVEVAGCEGGCYRRPAIVAMPAQTPIVRAETFAPILYVLTYEQFDDAIALANGVPQGLSAAVFTNDLREAETFVGPAGSDCGIANVNLGTSGAEIGGAFGGEKETGGGRESGSDAWKAYMRRATNTINRGRQLPLAQGVRFDV